MRVSLSSQRAAVCVSRGPRISVTYTLCQLSYSSRSRSYRATLVTSVPRYSHCSRALREGDRDTFQIDRVVESHDPQHGYSYLRDSPRRSYHALMRLCYPSGDAPRSRSPRAGVGWHYSIPFHARYHRISVYYRSSGSLPSSIWRSAYQLRDEWYYDLAKWSSLCSLAQFLWHHYFPIYTPLMHRVVSRHLSGWSSHCRARLWV